MMRVMRLISVGSLICGIAGCVQTKEQRLQDIRPGCVDEKVAEESYTEEFALLMCEGEAFVFGTDSRPDYQGELEKVEDEFNQALDELDALATCLESWDYNPPEGACD